MSNPSPVPIEKLYTLFRQFRVITTDSRNVPPRSLFFALKGESYDGNRFASAALDHGAAIAVVDDPDVVRDSRYILVKDVLESLQQLALCHRNHVDIPVIGITGSNGKTTTKELIHAVLATKYRTISTQGNLNNQIGVPLTLLSIQPETEMAVVEMGANHPGEIDFLCELTRPTHGLITNIGLAHLEGFGGFEGVVRAKMELYGFLRKHGGIVFVNLGDPLLTESAARMNTVTYGLVPGAFVSGTIDGDSSGIRLLVDYPNGKNGTLCSTLFGSYNALNILAAACVGIIFGISINNVTRAIASYTPVNNRSQIHRTDRNLLILDAYNANPSSMRMTLQDFDSVFDKDKIVILGDMLELGSETEAHHQQILALLETLNLTRVFLVGPVFSKLNKRKRWHTFPTSKDARNWFDGHPLKKANILLKASRGIQLEEVVPSL